MFFTVNRQIAKPKSAYSTAFWGHQDSKTLFFTVNGKSQKRKVQTVQYFECVKIPNHCFL